MRAIDSALALNHERRHTVRVIWPRDADLNCRFDEIFERPEGVDGVFDYGITTPSGRVLKFLLPRVLQNVVSRAIHQNEMDHLLADGFDFSSLLPLRSAYIRTWDRFYTGKEPLAKFKLVPKLRAVVDSCQIVTQRTVGVHIRRTDNQWLRHSPTDEFVRLMEEEINNRPDTVFFVATDSGDEEEHLKKCFVSGQIITHPKQSLDRNSPGAIKDAAVDLFCLARCRKIIGSHRSSFSEAASLIGRCPLVFAQKSAVGQTVS